MSELKATNPKDAIGSSKLPIHLWPTTASAMGSIGLLDGMLKYGRANWRASGVRASIYFDAANRHLNAWFEGEECDPDSGVPHLAHALACLAIIVDAQAAGKLNDDRQHKGGYRALINELTGHVGRLKEMHADKAPKHFTIADMPEAFGQQNTIDCRTKEERAADIGRQLADGVRRAASGAVCNDPRTVVGLDVSFPTERHMNFAPEKRSVQCGDCGYPYQGLPRQHCKHHYAEASHA
ncbi:dATP/dGTP diphosphohydrolase domain-containing protein [Stutzerimonas stutzeri]|uniref:DUF5664 domain-containing protein n=1 Tax=Stutzerimonas stutzeri TaxID=316 RepID=A0AA42TEX9_STUST|nr:dATP/dGTP diphosphohydrolase domain-containing protein [Stutzerimonas stutzeri]MDH1234465.1 DUF5664 domain-containing protein [Stutzerimonas stutzeri]